MNATFLRKRRLPALAIILFTLALIQTRIRPVNTVTDKPGTSA